jgi:hypothetical protein
MMYGDDRDSVEVAREQSAIAAIKNFVHTELQNIGLEKVEKLTKIYGKDDIRVKQAKVDSFFKAYAVLGTVRYAAQVVGVNPTVMTKLIKTTPQFKRRFEQAHEEFCQYLEQAAVVRAMQKSDSLLQFLLKANNPHKFSERLRLEAEANKSAQTPVSINFGYSDGNDPNYAQAQIPASTEGVTIESGTAEDTSGGSPR